MTADTDQIRALAEQIRNGGGTRRSALTQHPIPLLLGNIPVPWELETRHWLFAGTTGAGKSQAIYTNLSRIRQRKQPVICVDHSAEFLQRYYREGVDFILNPFDTRSEGWSPFNEIFRIYDFDRMAAAIIPDIPGENQEWQIGAQMIVADVMRELYAKGPTWRTNKALLHFLSSAPLRGQEEGSLEHLLRERPTARFFEKGNEKSLAITMGIIARYLQPLTYLKEGTFSVTKFVKSFAGGKQQRWLFLSYTDSSYRAIRALFSILVSSAIQAGLELSESKTRRFFYVLDEFSSIDKVDAVDDALVKLRKRGGVVQLGVQSTSQLVQTYSEEGAQTLLSCLGNALFLRVSDDQTAEKFSKMVGQVEVWEESYNESAGSSTTNGGQQSTTTNESSGSSRQKQVKDAILPSEFTWLPDLTGYARIAGHAGRVFPTTVQVSNLPLVAEAELTRPDVRLEPESDIEGEEYLLPELID